MTLVTPPAASCWYPCEVPPAAYRPDTALHMVGAPPSSESEDDCIVGRTLNKPSPPAVCPMVSLSWLTDDQVPSRLQPVEPSSGLRRRCGRHLRRAGRRPGTRLPIPGTFPRYELLPTPESSCLPRVFSATGLVLVSRSRTPRCCICFASRHAPTAHAIRAENARGAAPVRNKLVRSADALVRNSQTRGSNQPRSRTCTRPHRDLSFVGGCHTSILPFPAVLHHRHALPRFALSHREARKYRAVPCL